MRKRKTDRRQGKPMRDGWTYKRSAWKPARNEQENCQTIYTMLKGKQDGR